MIDIYVNKGCSDCRLSSFIEVKSPAWLHGIVFVAPVFHVEGSDFWLVVYTTHTKCDTNLVTLFTCDWCNTVYTDQCRNPVDIGVSTRDMFFLLTWHVVV